MPRKAALIVIGGCIDERFAKRRMMLVPRDAARFIRARLRGAEMVGMEVGGYAVFYSGEKKALTLRWITPAFLAVMQPNPPYIYRLVTADEGASY